MAEESRKSYTKEVILQDTIKAIKGVNSGWETQFNSSIGPDTFLGADLAFKSLDLVRLVASIQQNYSHKIIPFQELFISDNGSILQDIQISHLVSFLYKHLN